jgi:hypothetical protein
MLVIDGTANAVSSAAIPTEELPAALRRVASAVAKSSNGTAAERLKRLAPARIAHLFGARHG